MSEYQVRLILDITAESPVDAVSTFIEALVSHGMREWKYKVIDEDGNEILLWGDTLEEVTRDELVRDILARDDLDLTAEDLDVLVEHGEDVQVVGPNEDAAALTLAEELLRDQVEQEPEAPEAQEDTLKE